MEITFSSFSCKKLFIPHFQPCLQSNLCPCNTSLHYPRCIKYKSELGYRSFNDHLGQLISDSLSRQPATVDFLPSDIAVTPLAKVLEVNDGRQCLAVSEPAQISRPLSIQSQNKGWSREQAPQVHFVQPSHTLSFKHWHIETQGAIRFQHCLGLSVYGTSHSWATN